MITHKIEIEVPKSPVYYGSGIPLKIHSQSDLDKYIEEHKDIQPGKILKYKSCGLVTNAYSIHMVLNIDRDYNSCKNRGTDNGNLKCFNISNFSWNPTLNTPNWTRWEACHDMQVANWEECKDYIDDNLQNNFKQWARRNGYNLPETCFS